MSELEVFEYLNMCHCTGWGHLNVWIFRFNGECIHLPMPTMLCQAGIPRQGRWQETLVGDNHIMWKVVDRGRQWREQKDFFCCHQPCLGPTTATRVSRMGVPPPLNMELLLNVQLKSLYKRWEGMSQWSHQSQPCGLQSQNRVSTGCTFGFGAISCGCIRNNLCMQKKVVKPITIQGIPNHILWSYIGVLPISDTDTANVYCDSPLDNLKESSRLKRTTFCISVRSGTLTMKLLLLSIISVSIPLSSCLFFGSSRSVIENNLILVGIYKTFCL